MTRLIVSLALLALLTACTDSNNNNSGESLLPISNPTVEDPPDEGIFFLLANTFNLSEVGYEAQEYFLSGTAASFTNLSELTTDGMWEVEAAEEADYITRIVVHRPIDPAAFSGTAVVEWLNVTSGFDIPPSWGAGHVELYRSGHVWVGVSAQLVGIEGREDGLAPLYLKAVNPARYDGLSHPGDSFAFDIFSQVSAALHDPQGIDPLSGLEPQYLIAVGQSQSASFLTTYINAIQPLYNPYDGYIVHSRGGGAGPLSQPPQADLPAPDGLRIRTDINVPVITFQTETDVTGLNYVIARQDDGENFRLWEVAGTAHSDVYTIVNGRADADGGAQYAAVVEISELPGFISCNQPFNAGPMHYVFNKAIRDMDNWIRTGEAPPSAPRLDLNDDQSDYLKDDLGNSVGGIRTPYVDAPSAIFSGVGNTGDEFCFLLGSTFLFGADQMASLYVDAGGFTAAVTEAANAAVDAGFLLQIDAAAIIAWAPLQWGQQVGD